MAEATQEMIAVMQNDREAAADIFGTSPWSREQFLSGKRDKTDKVQAFARHRRNTEAEIISSLRHDFDEWPDYVALADVADALESAHLKEQSA